MKKAVNIRLEESMIFTLNQLAKELNTTKTDIIEKAIKLFSKNIQKEQDNLLKYAGILKKDDAEIFLNIIKNDKNIKDFEFDL